jgi:uroporphyrin-III C-methyltransferase
MTEIVTTGSVHLVGAGPGDADLLTLKAVRTIRAATVLLVDDLVGEGVLKYARESARIVYVGKRGGCASTPQAFIEKLMAAEALKGERVVRLKGGDPLLFGRGGEEIEYLQALGIRVEVVNGITSGLAAVNALGVALTHRKHAHGVMFVTGHPQNHAKAEDAAIHWPTFAACAAQGITLVIYMGITSIQNLQRGLLQGLPADTPIAVVQHASLPQQRSVVSTLNDLADAVEREQLASPSIIIVGDVLSGLAQVAMRSEEAQRTA